MKKVEAIALVGSKAKLARLLGISKGAVSQWEDDIPALRELQLEKLLKIKPRSPSTTTSTTKAK